MADHNGTYTALALQTRPSLVDQKLRGAKVRKITEIIDLATVNGGAAVPNGNDILIATVPKDSRFVMGCITTDASIATTTWEVGDADDPNRLRVGTVAPAAGTPQFFCAAAGLDYEFPAETQILVTAGTANSPTSGKMKIDLWVTDNS